MLSSNIPYKYYEKRYKERNFRVNMMDPCCPSYTDDSQSKLNYGVVSFTFGTILEKIIIQLY